MASTPLLLVMKLITAISTTFLVVIPILQFSPFVLNTTCIPTPLGSLNIYGSFRHHSKLISGPDPDSLSTILLLHPYTLRPWASNGGLFFGILQWQQWRRTHDPMPGPILHFASTSQWPWTSYLCCWPHQYYYYCSVHWTHPALFSLDLA